MNKKSKTKDSSKGMKSKFDKKTSYKRRKIAHALNEFLEKAGVQKTPRQLNKVVLIINAILLLALTVVVIVKSSEVGLAFRNVIPFILAIWTLVFIVLYLISILITFVYLDLKIYQRKEQIEEVLPDFLQLTSANIDAGMTVDRALWLAVRPRFGVLAKEMEEIAKATTAGEDLDTALRNFEKKYNSRILTESINLLIAGINAGGQIGTLLDKISSNIKETEMMRKEISATVMTYVIFIGAASIVAAPGLFALSTQLLSILQSVASTTAIGSSGGAGQAVGGFSFSFSSESISMEDFQTFAITLTIITTTISTAIISVIKKGKATVYMKYLPILLGVSIAIYFIGKVVMEGFFGGII